MSLTEPSIGLADTVEGTIVAVALGFAALDVANHICGGTWQVVAITTSANFS